MPSLTAGRAATGSRRPSSTWRPLRPGVSRPAPLPEVVTRPAGAAAHALDAAPGLRHRHYAPLVDEVLLAGGPALERAWPSAAALVLRQTTAAGLRGRPRAPPAP